MGSFYGGSSIIRRGKFSSYDPADGSPVSNKPSAGKSKSKKLAKATAKADPRPSVVQGTAGAFRLRLLHSVIDRMLQGNGVRLPRDVPHEFSVALSEAGSPEEWAKQQPEFDGLVRKKSRKLAKRKALESQEVGHRHDGNSSGSQLLVVHRPTSGGRSDQKAAQKAARAHDKARIALVQSLVAQMLKGSDRLQVPRLDRQLLEQVKTAGSALEWVKAQPEYASSFSAALAKQARRHRGAKASLNDRSGASGHLDPKQGAIKQAKPPLKRKRDSTGKAKPLGDVPVSFILKRLEQSVDDHLDPRKIDWDAT